MTSTLQTGYAYDALQYFSACLVLSSRISERERKTQRDRRTDRGGERDRQTDGQTDRQTDRQTDSNLVFCIRSTITVISQRKRGGREGEGGRGGGGEDHDDFLFSLKLTIAVK